MADGVELADKVAALRARLQELGSVVIGYSGGVDSSYLAAVAADVLGARALAVTSDSASLPRQHLADSAQIARQFNIVQRVIPTHELENADYAANRPDRCYHCKSELFKRLRALADAEGFAHVLDGTNVDDQGDYRPGRRAALERGVRSPLAELGFTKADIRAASRALGLPTADRPASACLASRIPYGTPVTAATLTQIDQAEAALRAQGFMQVRVRAHGDVARIELAPSELPRLLDAERRESVVTALRGCGFRYIALDLQGYRTGSLNEALKTSLA